MNKLIKNIVGIICLVAMFVATSCDTISDEITSLTTDRLFRPVNFSTTNVKTKFTFTWAASQYASSYTLQVSTDSANFSTLTTDTTLTGLTFSQEFQGSTQYYARIKANASDTTKNSKFELISFKTPAENIFLGYGTSNNTGNLYSACMTDIKTLTVKWTPGVNVTHLILTSANESLRDSVVMTSNEIASGSKIISGLTNSNWKVQIYNGKFLRGTTHGLIEGDVILNAGDNLLSAMTNATPGQVILLAPGAVFPIGGGAYNFDKNIKIKCASPTSRSVVCMTAGTPTATANMFGVVAGSAIDSLVFENIDITGYCSNDPTAVKIGYLYSNKVASTVGSMKYINCNIHNFGNTTFRISGAVNQTITNLTYNGCIINEIGFTSTYALVNTNSADFVNNINFLNSTIYNFKGSLILRTTQTINSINITNCSINQAALDASSARYMFDLNTATFAGAFTVKNTIFGSSAGALGANGFRGTVTPTFTGYYYTTDYVDDPIPAPVVSTSLKSKMTAYSGASTSLWTDPINGNFSLKDTGFAGKGVAGDLRW